MGIRAIIAVIILFGVIWFLKDVPAWSSIMFTPLGIAILAVMIIGGVLILVVAVMSLLGRL